MNKSTADELKKKLHKDWSIIDENKLHREFDFETFTQSIDFINKIAKIAEKEQHHPNIYVFFNKVQLELFTHAIGGLHENDFVLAAKIDQVYERN